MPFLYLLFMTYYHGRGNSRPYYGKHIYITSSIDYALLYAQDGFIYECELLCGKDKIFSIRNRNNLDLLKLHVPIEIINKLNLNEEISWEQLSYLSTDKFEEPEELLAFLGFKGISLKERTNVDSLYIFNQEDVHLGKKIKA